MGEIGNDSACRVCKGMHPKKHPTAAQARKVA